MKEAKTVLHAKIEIDGVEQEALIMPITRLDCIEGAADVMEKAAKDDCIPIMDTSNDGQMKKISIEQLFGPDSPAGSVAKAEAITSEAKSNAEAAKSTADQAKTMAQEAKAAAETARSAVSEIQTQLTEGGGVPASTLGGKPAAEFAPAAHTHDDRYYTEQEINDLLAGKAASSHAHTTTDITNFPASLPANGGNADTVDGAHVVTDAEPGLHRMASGTAAATSANCPPGTWYGQYE